MSINLLSVGQFMHRPFIAQRMNQQFRRTNVNQLPGNVVNYADEVVRGLHCALRAQTEPLYHRPEHYVDGWGLTATPLRKEGEFMGIPTVTILGSRAIYLSTTPDVMHRVLTVPHPRKPFEDQVIQIKNTSVPELLSEDPTLYYGLLNSVDDNIRELGLDYQLREAPVSPDTFSY